MANVKFVGEAALGRVADYVNAKLTFVSSMPESPTIDTVVLYVGVDSDPYLQGGVYQFDGTDWNLINMVKAIELTQDEYEALPVGVQNNGAIYFITDADFPGSVAYGYYNSIDGKFYRNSAMTQEIEGGNDVLYVSLDTNVVYRYDMDYDVFIQVSASGGGGSTIVYVNTLPVVGIQDTIYGLTTYDNYEETVDDNFLDDSALFVRIDSGDDYTYTAAAGKTIEATTNGANYKGFTSLAYDGINVEWTLIYSDDTTETLVATDIFYYRDKKIVYYAGRASDQSTRSLISVDTQLSSSSSQPVENRVINSALNNKVDKISGKDLSTNDFNDEYKDKLDGIADGANVNVQVDWEEDDSSSDAYINNKPELGSAAEKDVPVSGDASSDEVVLGNDSRLTDAREASDVYTWAKAATKPTYTASEVGAVATSAVGEANGVAELDSNGKIVSSQLPSYVDDVEEYPSLTFFPVRGETGKIYVAIDTNKTYRWSGSDYVELTSSVALGETSSTAYRGDRGKTAYDHSQLTNANPHAVTLALLADTNISSPATNSVLTYNGSAWVAGTASGSPILPINPSTTPTEPGSIWIETS